jgi:hypothetical protein
LLSALATLSIILLAASPPSRAGFVTVPPLEETYAP